MGVLGEPFRPVLATEYLRKIMELSDAVVVLFLRHT